MDGKDKRFSDEDLKKMTDQDPARRKDDLDEKSRKRLGISLRAIRESKGISREELAKLSGYQEPDMISAIENGNRGPAYGKVKDIANALDVSIEQLKAYGKISFSDKGWPILTESERTSLYVLGPIIESLDEEDVLKVIDYAITRCRAKGKEPKWKKPNFGKNKEK